MLFLPKSRQMLSPDFAFTNISTLAVLLPDLSGVVPQYTSRGQVPVLSVLK